MSDIVWKINAVQFPRLLTEINACGLSYDQVLDICASMDITQDELYQLFERAEAEWRQHLDVIKEELKG